MRIICMAAGALCLCYFFGIMWYTGLSSKFPVIWAAAGVILFGIDSFFAAQIPVFVKVSLLVLLGIFLLIFLAVEICIFRAMFQEPKPGLDYLVVLGAQVNGIKISRSLCLRLDKACSYLKENPKTMAVLSGGQGVGENVAEAEAMYGYLRKKGIGANRLRIEKKSRNTKQNLEYSLKLTGREKTIGIVTNNFHIFRSVLMGKQIDFKEIVGISAKSDAFLFVNYMVREFFSLIKYKIIG